MAVSLARTPLQMPSDDIFLCIGAGSDHIEKFFADDGNKDTEEHTTTNEER